MKKYKTLKQAHAELKKENAEKKRVAFKQLKSTGQKVHKKHKDSLPKYKDLKAGKTQDFIWQNGNLIPRGTPFFKETKYGEMITSYPKYNPKMRFNKEGGGVYGDKT